jgi:hypothetical protein
MIDARFSDVAGTADVIASIQARLTDLEKGLASKAPLSDIEPILKELSSDTGAVASSNRKTLHVLRGVFTKDADQFENPTISATSRSE